MEKNKWVVFLFLLAIAILWGLIYWLFVVPNK